MSCREGEKQINSQSKFLVNDDGRLVWENRDGVLIQLLYLFYVCLPLPTVEDTLFQLDLLTLYENKLKKVHFLM